MKALAIMLAALAGCVRSSAVSCESGGLCPEGHACFALTTSLGTELDLCVTPQQRTACDGKLDGALCDLTGATGGGSCHGGVCLVAICGNGLLDAGEVCDDENVSNDDRCSADCSSTLVCGNSLLDAIRGEQCDQGDALGHDGCTSTCQLERARWLEILSERPRARTDAALAYDVSRRRTVLFGGARDALYPLDDTSEWDGERWRVNTSTATPTNRYAHVMAYDADRDELVVFSGVNNQSDTWVTVDGAWQQRLTAHAPPTRDYAGMVFDGARKRVLLFGGFSPETGEALNDTWVWDGVDWQELSPATRPPPLLGFGMAYDPRRNVTVVFGGSGTVVSREDQVWEFDGVTWANRTPSQRPSPRTFPRMAFDPSTNELLMSGGNDGSAVTNDVHSWDGTRWVQRASLPTGDRFVAHAMTTDPVRGRVVVLGTNGTLYEGSAGSWITPSGGTPSAIPQPRDGAAMSLDPLRNEIVMFGGAVAAADPQFTAGLDETWVWISGWSQQSPSTIPPARWGAAMAYDEIRRELVMYGGCAPTNGFADTWVWRGGTPSGAWTRITASSAPGERCQAAMAFDAKRGKIVLVGGREHLGSFATNTWTWDGSTWTQEPTTSTPPQRSSPSIAYDRRSERIILFGGAGASNLAFDETWTWDGSSWTQLQPPTVPPGRAQASLAWDPARARAVLAGGVSIEGNYTFADAYEWDGADWIPIVSDYPARRAAGMTTAPDGAGILMFGGDAVSPATSPQLRLADTLRLRWDGDVGYEACTDRDGDGDGLSGCLDPDCWWSCTPTCPPRTTCATGAPGCGDQICNASLESCYACPADCGACPTVCGDVTCGPGETIASCPGDCSM